MKHNKQHNVYTYLAESGILESGTAEEIATMRKEYWKQYRIQYRRNQRQTRLECNVSFTGKEQKEIQIGAIAHHLTVTAFVRKASLSYLRNESVALNAIATNEIYGMLTMIYTKVQLLEELNESNTTHLTHAFAMLERKLIQLLNYEQ